MPAGGEAAARTFYGDALGLQEVPKPAQLAGAGWGVVRVRIDRAAIRSRLAGAGITLEEDDSGLPVARGYLREPFGNRVELVDAAGAGFSLRPPSDGYPL